MLGDSTDRQIYRHTNQQDQNHNMSGGDKYIPNTLNNIDVGTWEITHTYFTMLSF